MVATSPAWGMSRGKSLRKDFADWHIQEKWA